MCREADFTCQVCGWRFPDPPADYDGKRALFINEPTGKFRNGPYRRYEVTRLRGLEIDHIHPWSLSHNNSRENLQVLCTPCNVRKHNRVGA